MSPWQLIFRQSRVNNGIYDGDRLPAQNWDWPQGTWLQERLRYLRHLPANGSTPFSSMNDPIYCRYEQPISEAKKKGGTTANGKASNHRGRQ